MIDRTDHHLFSTDFSHVNFSILLIHSDLLSSSEVLVFIYLYITYISFYIEYMGLSGDN